MHEPDVADLAQHVFLVVFRLLPQFQGRSSLTSWLFAICRRTASTYRRAASRRRQIAVGFDYFEELHSEAEDPGAELEREERLDAADALLARLPETQRVALVLLELEELPALRIAELLQVSVGTLRSRLRLARRRIELMATKDVFRARRTERRLGGHSEASFRDQIASCRSRCL